MQRPQIVNAIAEARAHGDLRENAEYHAAKEQQSFIEGRIQEIESKLSQAHIIDVTKFTNEGKVIFGATVHLLNIDTAFLLRNKVLLREVLIILENHMLFALLIYLYLLRQELKHFQIERDDQLEFPFPIVARN